MHVGQTWMTEKFKKGSLIALRVKREHQDGRTFWVQAPVFVVNCPTIHTSSTKVLCQPGTAGKDFEDEGPAVICNLEALLPEDVLVRVSRDAGGAVDHAIVVVVRNVAVEVLAALDVVRLLLELVVQGCDGNTVRPGCGRRLRSVQHAPAAASAGRRSWQR